MSDPFVGEIRLVPWNWAPDGWFLCNGQTLQITQYQALYALIGNTYGGDGRTTFMLPNLQGRVVGGLATNQGTLPAGVTWSKYAAIAGFGGAESGTGAGSAVTLAAANLPGHTHPATFTPTGGGGGGAAQVNVTAAAGTTNVAAGNMLAKGTTGGGDDANTYAAPASPVSGQLAGVSGGGGITGGTVAVQTNNPNPPTPVTLPGATVPVLQPYLVLNYIIAWNGIFPTRP